MITEIDTKPIDAAAGYEQVQKLIFSQVHKFVAQYGGDFDELIGEAHEAFMKAHNQFMVGHNPAGTTITHNYATEVRRWVWFELFDKMRIRLDRNTKTPFVPLEGHDVAKELGGFNEEEFVAELSEDGAYVAGLVLHPFVVITRDAEAKGGTPCNYRSTVRAYLRLMGWPTARINTAFTEIKTALG